VARLGGSTAILTILDDESFNIPAGSTDTIFATGLGANDFIQTMVLQTNGSIIIGGNFTQFNEVPRSRIARLTRDGALDTTFLTTGSGFNGTVRALVLQPDGRLLAGGAFTNINGTNRNYIARLNSDGTTDSSFNPGAGADNPVNAIALYTSGANSGRIVIGGAFASMNGTPRNFLARLNSDGSLDTTFDVGTGANGAVHAIAIQPDGKVVVGGDFTTFNGTTRSNIIRLNLDGSVDTSFNSGGAGANGSVRAIAVQTDGKILAGGLFTTYNGTNNNRIVRLTTTGADEASFTAAVSGGANNAVYSIALQDDGKIVVGGDFSQFGGVTRNRATRLTETGAVDPTINFGTGANSFVAAVRMQVNTNNVEQILLAGGFTTFNDSPASYITRVNGGSLAGPGRIEFTTGNYTVSEAGNNVLITIRRIGGTTDPVSATFSTSDGTALSTLHYGPHPFPPGTAVSFPQGEVLRTVQISVTNDAVVNTDRTVNLALAGFLPGSAAGNQTTAILTIVNDDATVGFTAANFSVNENVAGGFATINVNRLGGTSNTVQVTYYTLDSTATHGLDYIGVTNTLTFLTGQTNLPFTVPVINETPPLVEGNETFTVNLINPVGTVGNAALGLSTATVTIVDDDFSNGLLVFNTNSYSVSESGGSLTVVVLRTNGSTGVVSVQYATANGTALGWNGVGSSAGFDYVSTNNTLTFADGEVVKTFNVNILGDTEVEGNETFSIALSPPTGGATLGTPNSALITIVDDDFNGGTINFLFASQTVTEGTGLVTVPVSRSAPTVGQAQVVVSSIDGTATNGLDYNFTNATLIWAAGDGVNKTVTYTVVDFNNTTTTNLDRTFTLRLSGVTGGAGLGSVTNHVVTIQDNTNGPGNIYFSAANYAVFENSNSVALTLLRTNGTAGAVNIIVNTSANPGNAVPYNGGSTSGTDYTNTLPDTFPRTIAFASGQTSAVVAIGIIDNQLVDGNRTLNLTLTKPGAPLGWGTIPFNPANTGAELGAQSTATLTILDNESASGSVDTTFNTTPGPNTNVNSIAIQPDGKALIGGEFTTVDAVSRNRVARLNADGTLDTTFNPGTGASGAVRSVSLQGDGKVVVGGLFTNVNGSAFNRLARLNADGSLDATFTNSFANNAVNAVIAQSDGKVVVGGIFTTISGTNWNFVARLTTNGAPDTAFNPGSGADGQVRALAVQPDGKILIGGDFAAVNGTPRTRIARLNADGTLDTTFNPGTGASDSVYSIALQVDGRIVIGGLFTSVNGSPAGYVTRLNSDGSVDTANFSDAGTGANDFVTSVAVQPDGRIVIVGAFTSVNGLARNRIARLDQTGAVDPALNIGAGANNTVNTVRLQGDGKLVIGGAFTAVDGIARNYVARLNGGSNPGSGSVEYTASVFSVSESTNTVVISLVRRGGLTGAVAVTFTNTPITALRHPGTGPVANENYTNAFGTLTLPQGVTTTNFTVGIINQPGVAGDKTALFTLTALPAGLNDPTFSSFTGVAGVSASVRAVAVQSDGKILIGGDFTTVNGQAHVRIARLNANGSLDGTFNTSATADATVHSIIVQSDGKILIGGSFTNVNGTARSRLARLNSDGTLDTFDPNDGGVGPGQSIFAMALRGTTLIVAGDFTSFDSTAGLDRVARIANGVVDTSFVPSPNNSEVRAVAFDAAGNILIGGDFTSVNGGATARGRLARLNPDGTVDTTFADPLVNNNTVLAIGVQSDGQVVIGGGFTSIGAGPTTRNRVARFSAAGVLDPTFDPNAGGDVRSVLVQRDGRIVLGGDFSTLGGATRNCIARINASGSPDTAAFTGLTTGAEGAGRFVRATALDELGRLVVVGEFASMNSQSMAGVARLNAFGATPGAQSTSTLNIQDADSVLAYTLATYNVIENEGQAVITVARTGGAIGAVTAQAYTTDGTAIAGVDYTNIPPATPVTLTWTNGDSANKTFNVGIIDNLLTNSPRVLNLHLTNLVGNASFARSNATLTIVDNEFGPGVVGFSASNYTVLESGAFIVITVLRTNGGVGALSAVFTTSTNGQANPAIPNTDFTPTNGVFNWADGDNTNRTFTVFVADNFVTNADKTVGLLLTSISGGAVPGITNSVLTIQDNDSSFNFSLAAYSVSETNPVATVTVVRTGYTNDIVTVPIASTLFGGPGAATGGAVPGPGVDFLLTNTVLTFTNGVTALTFDVPIYDDATVEGDEFFLVTLGAPGSVPAGSASLGGQATAQVAILDDDAEFNFTLAAYTVTESGIAQLIEVVRTGVTNTTVDVQFGTTNVSAIAGLHYLGTNGTLTFTNGVRTQAFTVPIINNLVTNPARAVQLGLANPTGPFGTRLGAQSTATLTITDDDAAPLAGALDPGFTNGLNNAVYAVGIHANSNQPALVGKLVIGGDFTLVNGAARSRIARLNLDGSTDGTFLATGANSSVRALVAQADGSVVVGGFFTTLGGSNANYIGRLDLTGAFDTNFNTGSGPNNAVNALALQADGKVLVGGQFTSVNGTNRNFIARLNADGSLDTTFNPGSGCDGFVRSIVALADGSVLVGGEFNVVNGTFSRGLALLTTNGAVDTGFSVRLGAGVGGSVYSVAVQVNAGVTNAVIGGLFNTVSGQPRTNLARVALAPATSGTLEAGFAPSADGYVNTVVVQPDGRLVIGGSFGLVNGLGRNRIERLNVDGAPDFTINFGVGADNDVNTALVQFDDDSLVIGGTFLNFSGQPRPYLTRAFGRNTANAGSLEFTSATYVVGESTNAVITVRRTGGLQGPVSVQATATAGTATANVDFVPVNTTLNFAAGVNLQSFVVTNLDDVIPEGDETVNLTLVGASLTGGAVLGAQGTATLVIADDDSVMAFLSPAFGVNENGTNAVITVVRLFGTNGVVTVDYSTADGTATSPLKYLATNGTLVFGNGVATQVFLVRIIENAVADGNTTFTVLLSNPTGQSGATAVLGSPATATVTIVDDEFSPGVLTFSSAAYSVNENGGSAPITVLRTNGTLGAVSVQFATGGGTAVPGVRYTPTNGMLSWANGDLTPKTFSVAIIDTLTVEGNQTVDLTLSSLAGGAVLGAVSNAVLTIFDDDGVVQFSAAAYTVVENQTNAVVTVTRSGAVNNIVNVNYFTSDGTAVAGVKYYATNGTLTFGLGVTVQTFNVGLINNQVAEGTKSFNVHLTNLTGLAFLGMLTNAVVTILDDDVSVQFSSSAYAISESAGIAVINVLRAGATNGTVSVNYGTSDGSAVGGQDYVPQNSSLTFNPGETNKTFSITILNDALVEPDETVNLSLSLPVGAVLGVPATAVLTIVNDDTDVEYLLAQFTVSETATNATITVRRRGVTTNAFTVDFRTADGTAIAGVHYGATNGTLNFGAGVITRTFDVPVTNDLVALGDLFVNLLLTNAVGVPLGPQAAAILVIQDDEVEFVFAAPAINVLEDRTNAVINVVRRGSTTGTNTVDFATANGTAFAGSDYVATAATLTFLPGVTNVAVLVPLIDDITEEPSETVNLSLANPSAPATIGGPGFALLNIVDNDRIGSLDSQFDPGLGASNAVYAVGLYTNLAIPSLAGKILAAGDFDAFNSSPTRRVVRLNYDGTADTNFNVGSGADNVVYAVAVQPDGTALIGGSFTFVNGTNRNYVARLGTNGALDLTFGAAGVGAGPNGAVLAIARQPDGKVVIGGAFTSVDGQSRNRVARLNADGTLDTLFNPGAGANNLVQAVALDTNNMVLIGGFFHSVNGLSRTNLAQLDTNGVVQAAFTNTLGAGAQVHALAVQPDNSVVIAGSFTNVGGFGRTNIARVFGNGGLDPMFSSSASPNSTVRALGLQANGSVVVAGDFTVVSGASRNNMARLTSAGVLDTNFNIGTGFNGPVFALAPQPDGRVVAGGDFTLFEGISRNRIARLNGDHGVVRFATGTASVFENQGSITLLVVREFASSGTIRVDFGTGDVTAFAGLDYTTTNGTLAFVPGVTNLTITVPIVNDFIPEADKTFNLTLSNAVGGALGAPTNMVITILDDDSVFNFSAAAISVLEDTNVVTLTVTRTGFVNSTVTVPFLTLDGTALMTSDYVTNSGTLTFGPNVTSQTIPITIVNDALEETTKSFTVNLLPGTTGESSLGVQTNQTITILDNDSTLFFAFATTNVLEDVGTVTFEVQRTGYTNNTVSVGITTTNGTAVTEIDYTTNRAVLSFGLGVTSQTFTVTILNNQLEQPNRQFSALLEPPVTGEGSLGAQTVSTVTIVDNDSTLQFNVAGATVLENSGTVTLNVVRSGFTNNTVLVPFNTLNGMALAGQDYTTNSGTLNFAPGVTNLPITVAILNDTVVESTEAFTVVLTVPGGEGSLGAQATATVTILDDDSNLQWEVAATNVVERATNITINVTRTGYLTNTVSVPFNTLNGTALAGLDYTTNSGVLTFGTNVTTLPVTVVILNDKVVEPQEAFTINLGTPVGEASLGAVPVVTVTIDDDDSAFTVADVSVNERGGSVTLTVTRTGASNSVVGVSFATAPGTAFPGINFSNTVGTLTFGVGVTSQPVTVPIINNVAITGNRVFTLGLSAPTGESTLGVPSTANITILDDDSTLQFSSATASALESSGGLTVTVDRAGVVDTTVTVPFRFINGSATNGVDFLGTNGTLTFGTNETSKTVFVGFINNLAVQTNRSFTILLDPPTGEAAVVGNGLVTVTIVDDDSTLAFPAPTAVVSETATNLTVTVLRAGATNVAVSAFLRTADGTALAGPHYQTVISNIVFAAGESVKTVLVPIVNNQIIEGTRTFNVRLTNEVGEVTLAANSNLVVSILEDDFISLVPSGVTVLAESFSPTNNALDPNEVVTLNLAIRNLGNVPTTAGLVATLLPGGGVQGPSGPQSYAGLVENGSNTVSQAFTFTVNATDTVQATLQFQDGANNLGTATFNIALGAATSFTNRGLINVPGTIIVPSAGPASPYPSTLTVAGMTGVVRKVTVTLTNLTHTFPADVDVLLVSPTGQRVLLMSDAGAGNAVTNVTLTFDDGAGLFLPDLGQIISGSYKPTDYAPADVFPAPAPAGPYSTNLSAFNGFNPNGVWSLYIMDDTGNNNGFILNGWFMTITTVTPTVDLAASMSASTNSILAGSLLTYTTVITNKGPNTATGVVVTNVLPAGMQFVTATSSYGSVSSAGGQVVATLGFVTNGTAPTVSIVMTPLVPGLVTNVATATSAEIDLNGADNTASVVVTVLPGADVGLVAGITPSPGTVGSNVVVSISVTNRGPSSASGLLLTNALPPTWTFLSATTTLGSFSQSGSNVVFNLGTMASGGSASLTVTAGTASPGTFTNGITLFNIAEVNNADNVTNVVVTLTGQPRPTLTGGGVTGGGGTFGFTVNGQPGFTYVIERSANLVIWTPVFTNSTGGTFTFTDTNSTGFRFLFYRVVQR
jgi:uncharacterized delta-60 repeat protein